MMKSRQYAEAAARAGQLAIQIKPQDADPYAQRLNLAVHYLRAGAKILQEISEFSAQREGLPEPVATEPR